MNESWEVHVATLRHPDQVSRTRLEASLNSLLDAAKQDDEVRPKLAKSGALAPLIAIAARAGDYWVKVRQLCLQVLATISWHHDTGKSLVEVGMLPIAINALQEDDEVTVGRAMGILNNIAMYEQARKEMLASGVLEAIKPFLGSPALVGLDADKIVAYLVGKEDAKEHELMVAGEGSIERLVSAARDTLEGRQVCGLKLSMMGLLKAIRLIAINDNNKTRLVTAGAVWGGSAARARGSGRWRPPRALLRRKRDGGASRDAEGKPLPCAQHPHSQRHGGRDRRGASRLFGLALHAQGSGRQA